MTGLNDHLDACFLPLGLQAKEAIAGRNYEGQIAGRTVRVHCSARSRTQYYSEDLRVRHSAGFRLEMNVDTTLQARLVLAVIKGALMAAFAQANRLFDTARLVEKPAGLQHLDIWTHDLDWARTFLPNGQVQARLAALIPAADLPPNIGLRLWPGIWTYSQRTPLARITPENARAWVTALVELTNLAETAPAPARPAELTWYERQSQERPILVGLVTIALIMAIPLTIMGCFFAAVMAFISLTGL